MQWQNFSHILKEVLALSLSPVAITRKPKGAAAGASAQKIRICKAILDAASGSTCVVCKETNVCFGAAWHLGFHKLKDQRVRDMTRKFVVEGEKLFASYEALDNLLSQMEDVPDYSDSCFVLTPMEKAEQKPELVIFVCNPEQACRLLTLVMFPDGRMPKIKMGGPTCRLAIIYPLLTGEVNISFYDYTARKICNVPSDKLLVSIPYQRMPRLIADIDICSGGKAKVEYPHEFREFLRKRLTG